MFKKKTDWNPAPPLQNETNSPIDVQTSGIVTLTLNADDVFRLVGGLSHLIPALESLGTLAHLHRAQQYRELLTRLDREYAQLVNFHPPTTQVTYQVKVNSEL